MYAVRYPIYMYVISGYHHDKKNKPYKQKTIFFYQILVLENEILMEIDDEWQRIQVFISERWFNVYL